MQFLEIASLPAGVQAVSSQTCPLEAIFPAAPSSAAPRQGRAPRVDVKIVGCLRLVGCTKIMCTAIRTFAALTILAVPCVLHTSLRGTNATDTIPWTTPTLLRYIHSALCTIYFALHLLYSLIAAFGGAHAA